MLFYYYTLESVVFRVSDDITHKHNMRSELFLVSVLASTTSAFLAGSGAQAQKDLVVAYAAKRGFSSSAAAPARKKKSDASGLTPENGWVEMLELDELVSGGLGQAAGRSVTGKPYLVRRSSSGKVCATSVECGRCDYPVLKSEVKTVDGVDEIECGMCGSTYDATTGASLDKNGKGNPLFGGLLKNKPQKPLRKYPTKELGDGRIFVNIESSR